jgi:hypothetical protein
MNRPESLNHLLEELRAEAFQSSVSFLPRSKAVIYIHPNDRAGIELTGEECALLMHSPETVDRLTDCFEGGTDESSLEVYDLALDDEVVAHLESVFISIDEM